MAAGWLGSDPIDDRTIHGSRAERELRTWAVHEGGMPYEQHRAVHPFWKNVESVEQDGDNGWWVRSRDGVDEYVPVENREELKRMKGGGWREGIRAGIRICSISCIFEKVKGKG